jgi:hypothetical protein
LETVNGDGWWLVMGVFAEMRMSGAQAGQYGSASEAEAPRIAEIRQERAAVNDQK